MNPLARSYSRLKQFNQNPQYNPGTEAVYNRAMSAPTAPNIGGEIIRNILGAYVGSKIGEAKKNYLESEREKERTQRLNDEKMMLDYRVGLEAKAVEERGQKAYQGLLGTMMSEGPSPTPVTGIPSGLSPEIYNEATKAQLVKRGLLPAVKEATTGRQPTKEVDLGNKTRVYYNDGTFEDISKGAVPGKAGEDTEKRNTAAQAAFDDLDKLYLKKASLESLRDEFGGIISPEDAKTSLTTINTQITKREALIKSRYPQEWATYSGGVPAITPAPMTSDATTEKPGILSRTWSGIFGGEAAPATTPTVTPDAQTQSQIQVEDIDAEIRRKEAMSSGSTQPGSTQPAPVKKRESLDSGRPVYMVNKEGGLGMETYRPVVGQTYIKPVKVKGTGMFFENTAYQKVKFIGYEGNEPKFENIGLPIYDKKKVR